MTHTEAKKTAGVLVWASAARPRTLPAAAAPVIMGAAMAAGDGVFHAGAAIAALFGALLIQVGANYANDYYDYVKGADTETRLGPVRATQAGLVAAVRMKWAAVLVLGAAAIPGVYLVYRGGVPILVIGVLSILFAVLYTGGPLPLGYIGVADLFVLVFFGPVAVAGTYYVQARVLTSATVIAGLAPGLLSMAILTVNNLRDIEQDRQAGKKTLAVRFGPGFARFEYTAALLLAVGVIPILACFTQGGNWGALIALLMLGPAMLCIKNVFGTNDGTELNTRLADTGKLLLVFSILFSLGWLLTA